MNYNILNKPQLMENTKKKQISIYKNIEDIPISVDTFL